MGDRFAGRTALITGAGSGNEITFQPCERTHGFLSPHRVWKNDEVQYTAAHAALLPGDPAGERGDQAGTVAGARRA